MSFHWSGRNANTPFMDRQLVFEDSAGNKIYKENLINGKKVLAGYNADGALLDDPSVNKLIKRGTKAGAFGGEKVTKLNPHTGKRHKKGDEKRFGQYKNNEHDLADFSRFYGGEVGL